MTRLSQVRAHPLSVALAEPLYTAHECHTHAHLIVVEVRTDDGLVGTGEVHAGPMPAVCEWIERLGALLVGHDVQDTTGAWERLFALTSPRPGGMFAADGLPRPIARQARGAVMAAIGGIDLALWDLRGKAEGKPCWQLLGGATKDAITPYASLLPEGDDLETYTRILVERAEKARELGFRAVKLEVCTKGPYSHNSLQIADDREIARIVRACRQAIGPEMTVMVDVAYCWRDWKEALRAIEMFADADIFFVETPLPSDDVEGYAKLVHASPVRIAAGEWLNTRFEFLELVRAGALDVLQPDVGRVGGLTEARRVARIAEDHGLLVVPHCWKSAIGIAASAHLAAVSPTCTHIEFLPRELADSRLRIDLCSVELPVVDGRIPLPEAPGLGITLNEAALESFRV